MEDALVMGTDFLLGGKHWKIVIQFRFSDVS